jgi:mannose/fructose/N-acetylgalactosamine-specific phosphotransferase system component IID
VDPREAEAEVVQYPMMVQLHKAKNQQQVVQIQRWLQVLVVVFQPLRLQLVVLVVVEKSLTSHILVELVEVELVEVVVL